MMLFLQRSSYVWYFVSSLYSINEVDTFSVQLPQQWSARIAKQVGCRRRRRRRQGDTITISTTTTCQQTTSQSQQSNDIINDDSQRINFKKESIIWKIRPNENPSFVQRIQWYISGIYESFIVTMNHTKLQQQQEQPSEGSVVLFPRRLLFSSSGSSRDNDNNNNNDERSKMIVILATLHDNTVIGRFGIIPEPGRINPEPLQRAIQRIFYNSNNNSNYDDDDDDSDTDTDNSTLIYDTDSSSSSGSSMLLRVGAIIYMFVEPEYCGRNVGSAALDVIHTIQRSCQCTHTILVANDKTPPNKNSNDNNHSNINNSSSSTTTGSRRHPTSEYYDYYNNMKLVQWYIRHQYHIASELQDMLGSPNGIYGIAMITSLLDNERKGLNGGTTGTSIYDDDDTRHTAPIIQWW